MLFFLIILLLIIFNKAEFAGEQQFLPDYMSREKTNAIKGIFVILIVFSHWSQYVELGGFYDESYIILKEHLNQMVVSMFLFYSGYGMLLSTKKKGLGYVKNIPGKRFLTTWINFNLALILYYIVGTALGSHFGLKRILLSTIGWMNIGNSNWYMFAVFALYLVFFAAYMIGMKVLKGESGLWLGTVLFTIGTIGFVYFNMKMGRPGYCYNTAILFPLGCWYALFKKQIERIVMRNDYLYTAICLGLLAVYVISFRIRWKAGIEGFTVWAVSFTLLLVLATMKIGIHNAVLGWFGNHVFSVYILQRIPMMILDRISYFDSHKYTFLIVVIICTVFMAMIFDYGTGKLAQWMAKGKKA